MKYLKYLCSSLLLAGALGFAGCGSDGDTRADGDRNVLVQTTIDREIKVEGVVRSYKTGAPLDTIEVRLYQGGVKKSATTVSKDGHYAFAKIKVSDDKSASGANNAANDVQLEFVELKVKNSTGGSGNTHYSNGTTTATFPDSRLEFEYVSPEFTTIPTLTPADEAANNLADNISGNLTSLTLADAINEGRSYYFTDANTVQVRDVRLVQTGVLTGKTVDAETGLPVADAYVTISTDKYFVAANALNATDTTGGDIVAVWQQTRITATLSNALGEFTFASVPALDYNTSITGNDVDIFHVEAEGYNEKTQNWPDHANIRDDLVGTVGTILLTPITVKLKTVTMKFVNQNLVALAGVSVVFKFDPNETNAAGYTTALANAIATDVRWVATSDASGVATASIPNIGYNNVDTTQDFTAKLSGYKLDTTFTSIVIDEDDIKLDLSAFGGVDDAADLGIIKMIPDTKNFANEFRIQLIYKDAPVAGATVTGTAKYTDTDVSAQAITLLISGDAVSDSNGFVTFNLTKIPASLAGLSVTFDFDVSLTGATSIVSSLTGTYVVDDADDLDLTRNNYTDATVTTKAENDTLQVVIIDKALGLASLEGYIVTGKTGATNNTGTVSFDEAADVNLSLRVNNNGSVTTYFATTNADGFYEFLATDGVRIPVNTNNLDLRLTVLGDYRFSDTTSAPTNAITLDEAVSVENGVGQLDSNTAGADTTWLWQLNDTTADSLETKYDGKTLQVHTAAIEPNAAVETGFHVVTLLKTVSGVSTLPVIQTNAATNKVYTFTQSQDDATGIQIVMSKEVDSTKPFKYNDITTTGGNTTADTTDNNRLEIINFENGTQGNEIPDGAVLTFTATASGRTITVIPSGNANKFQQQVTYRIKIRAVSTDGNVSDDVFYFRFYNAETEKFSTQVPSYDVSTMTGTAKYWFLYNNVSADADNVKFGLNRNAGAIVAADVHILVYKDGTGFSYGTGAFQNQAINLNGLKLRFGIPTDLRTSAAANVNNATVATELADFKVWAQAYTASGIILQHWTNVTSGASSVGNQFLAYEANNLLVGADLSGQSDIWAKTIAEGNRIDLTVVHINSQIDPTAAKCLTITVSNLSGSQAKTLTQAAGDGNPVTSELWDVTLDGRVSATATATPTLSTTMPGVTLANVRYTDGNKISTDATLSFGNGTDVTVSATTSLNIASASIMVASGAGSSLVLSTATVTATLQTVSNEMRVGRNLRWDSDGATATTSASNSVITAVSTIVHTSIPIIDGTTKAVGSKDYTYGATGNIIDDAGDQSTTTSIDIDRNGGSALNAFAVGNVNTARSWDFQYNGLSDGRLKRLLNSLETGDIINATGNNFYLRLTGNPAGNAFTAIEGGTFASDVRTSLGYNAVTTTAAGGGTLVLAPQIRLTTTTFESDNTASGIADVVAAGSDASTGFRSSSNTSGAIIDTTCVEASAVVQLYAGDSINIMTVSTTATDGNEPVYSATVVGSISSTNNGTTLIILSGVTQIRGTTETFAAGGQTIRTNGIVFSGDVVTITSLGSGVTSLHSTATLNTGADAVTTNAYTDGNNVQDDNGEGFNAVK